MAVWVFFHDLNSGRYPRKKLHALVSRSARADATRALQLRKSLERRQPPGETRLAAREYHYLVPAFPGYKRVFF